MTPLLNSLFGSLAPLWEMSLTAAYVTAVVALLRMILKKRAPRQVLCVLWLVVFARLLVPVSLESPLSILPDEEQVQAVQNLPAKLVGGQMAPVHDSDSNHDPVQAGSMTSSPTSQGNAAPDAVPVYPTLSIPDGAVPNVQPQTPAGFPWQTLLAGVWLAGALAMCLYALVSYLSLKSRLYDAIRAEDGAWEHPSVGSPFILGVFRPRVYLPAGLWGMPRQFILCHERAHLRRFDHIVKPICWVALVLHWFNPAVWVAFILMSRDIEAACDEAVIRQLGPRVKADYSATLLSLATNGRVPAPCPLAFDEGDAKGRIQNVLRYRRPALWIVVVSVTMALMAAVCLLTDPVSAKEPDPDPDPSSTQSIEGLNGLLDPWMEEILAGRQNFTSTESGESVNIDLLNGAYPGEFTVTLSKFAIVDLDWDGLKELVLWPSIDGDGSQGRMSTVGYLILRRQGDTVYSYNPSYRSFYLLRTDGTFLWSSGSADHGVGSLRFDGNELVRNDITWCRSDENGELYFVDGQKAGQEEFEIAMMTQSSKLKVSWYVFKDGQVKYAPNSEALSGSELGFSAPDFLDDEQLILYYQTYIVYTHFFGPSSELVDSNSYGKNPVEYNGAQYWRASGPYADWNDFESTILSVFTENFWNTRNQNNLYVNINGAMHYLDYARGSGGYNENFPETFRLVEQTDDTISFIMTGYYVESRPDPGITNQQWQEWLASNWEYSIDYPMLMVKTDNGWRFDEFHNARTDNGLLEFSSQMVPNPNAPAADTGALVPSPGPTPGVTPEPSPEPTASTTTEPIPNSQACVHGMDDAYLEFLSNGGYELRCRSDGFVYGRFSSGSIQSAYVTEDMDGDGRFESAIYHEDGKITVYDVENSFDLQSNRLNTYTFDPNTLLPAFNQGRTAQIIQDEAGKMYLDVSYQGQTARISLDTQASLNHARTPDPLAYNAYLGSFINGLLWCGATVDLSSVFLDHEQILHPNWYVRYTGSGFQVVPNSFAFTISE